MLRRSIPQYEVMRKAVFDIGRRFAEPGTFIVDLGCSRGDALAPFVKEFGSKCNYLGLEISEPMLEAARKRFKDEIDSGVVNIEQRDLRESYPDVQASVTLCVLTLQFTPGDHRQRILNDVFRHTSPGGVLIVVEKVLGASSQLTALMAEIYHELKADHGYRKEEVERKRLATVVAANIRILGLLKQSILLGAEPGFLASKRPAAKKLSDPDGQVFSGSPPGLQYKQ